MITELTVRNLAILPEIQIRFRDRLNVLTGETGAGKSILVDAIGLLAGERASSDVVRAGEETALVEGILEMPAESPIWKALRDLSFPRNGNEIFLRRTVSFDGRSRGFVNDVSATAGALAALAAFWIDLSGQHGSRELLSEDFHLDLLDSYGDLTGAASSYREIFSGVRDLQRQLDELRTKKQEALRQRDFLAFQFRELTNAGLKAGEMEELEAQHKRLLNAHQLTTQAEEAEAFLSGDGGAEEKFGEAVSRIRAAAKTDPGLEPLLRQAEENYAQVRDLASSLSHYRRGLTSDPGDLDRLNERLARLQAIARKYGSIDQAIAEQVRIASTMALIEDSNQDEKELEDAIGKDAAVLGDAMEELTRKRKAAAANFAREVSAELKLLGMGQAELQIEFLPIPAEGALKTTAGVFGPSGGESVRILFAPNPGEGFKPLSRIASGGELSRVLLAVKSVALAKSSSDGVTYLFDEVDTGIGGEAAERVGIRMRALSEGRQVLCVTHLPQIACYACVHLRIEKRVREGRTSADVSILADEERTDELARMIGGIRVTRKTKDYAYELLERGKTRNRKGALTRV